MMSEEPVFQELQVRRRYFRWKIENFFDLPRNSDYWNNSPTFTLNATSVYLRIYPNVYHVSVYLMPHQSEDLPAGMDRSVIREGMSAPGGTEKRKLVGLKPRDPPEISTGIESLVIKMGILLADGSIYKMLKCEIKNRDRYLWSSLVTRPKLLEYPETFLPDGHLTVLLTAQLMEAPDDKAGPLASTDGTEILAENLLDILLTGRDADVTFRVQGREFHVHQLILTARSRVFYAMFQHSMTEKNGRVVEIEDCDPNTFQDFLLFLYTGRFSDVTAGNACALYILADKYDLQDLKEECARRMERDISIHNFFDIISVLSVFSECALLKTATDFFGKNAEIIIPSARWRRLVAEQSTIAEKLLNVFGNDMQ